MIGFDEGTGEAYIKPNAFKFDPDCSTYRRGVLEANDLNSTSLVRQPQNVVLGLAIKAVSECGFRFEDSPWPDGEQSEKIDVAHFSIYLHPALSKAGSRRALADIAEIDIHP